MRAFVQEPMICRISTLQKRDPFKVFKAHVVGAQEVEQGAPCHHLSLQRGTPHCKLERFGALHNQSDEGSCLTPPAKSGLESRPSRSSLSTAIPQPFCFVHALLVALQLKTWNRGRFRCMGWATEMPLSIPLPCCPCQPSPSATSLCTPLHSAAALPSCVCSWAMHWLGTLTCGQFTSPADHSPALPPLPVSHGPSNAPSRSVLTMTAPSQWLVAPIYPLVCQQRNHRFSLSLSTPSLHWCMVCLPCPFPCLAPLC